MMKKRVRLTLAFVAVAFCFSVQLSGAEQDFEDGLVLKSMWKTYRTARDADKPEEELPALDAIKTEALRRGLAWDYYNACIGYAGAVSVRNWKHREQAYEKYHQELEQSPFPVTVIFDREFSDNERKYEYLEAHREALEKSRNPEFWSEDYNLSTKKYRISLISKIGNDYEYGLWKLRKVPPTDEYPFSAFLEYDAIPRSGSPREKALEKYVSRWDGTAAGLMGREELIRMLYDRLDFGKSTEKQFLEIKSMCDSFEIRRRPFKGDEKLIADACVIPSGILSDMGKTSLNCNVEGDSLRIICRNVSSPVEVQLSDSSSVVFRSRVPVEGGRYCVYDTVSVVLPDIDDGDYSISLSSGQSSSKRQFSKASLSAVLRYSASGLGVFVYDGRSGTPLETCTLSLFKDGKVICEAEDFSMDGFTDIPAVMEETIQSSHSDIRWDLRIVASQGNRKSHPCRLPYRRTVTTEVKECPRVLLLTDKAAFNPSETVNFKVIGYRTGESLDLMPEGTLVTVELSDFKNNVLYSARLRLNGFGSAAGSFNLGVCDKGGRFRLSASCEGKTLESKVIRVDEFILPSFDVIWDENPECFSFLGDTLRFSGIVKAFSGHDLSAAEMKWEVNCDGRILGSGSFRPSPGGRFSLTFPTDSLPSRSCLYAVLEMDVTDAGGETLHFSKVTSITGKFSVNAFLLNMNPGVATGMVSRPGYDILTEDRARLALNCRGSTVNRPELSVDWTLLDSEGRELEKGISHNGDTLDVDFSARVSALYQLKFRGRALRHGLDTLESFLTCSIIRVSAPDGTVSAPLGELFAVMPFDGTALPFCFGFRGSECRVLAEIFSRDGTVLDRKSLKYEGLAPDKFHLKDLSFVKQADWPEDLSVGILCYGKHFFKSFVHNIRQEGSDSSLPLSFARFRDEAAPSDSCNFSIRTNPGVECAVSVYDSASEKIEYSGWDRMSLPYRFVFSPAYEYCPASDISEETIVEEAIPFMVSDNMISRGKSSDSGIVRHENTNTVFWSPFLRSDAKGEIDFAFMAPDRLSSYIIRLYAHDRNCKDNVIQREMKVTLPVRISFSKPRYLYEGDSYVARVSLVSCISSDVRGKLSARIFNGVRWQGCAAIDSSSVILTVPAGGNCLFELPVSVPDGQATAGGLGMLLSFTPDSGSNCADAIFVTVPVLRPCQTIKEAHSAVLMTGDDRNALENRLRSQFSSFDGSNAGMREISLLTVLGEALPERVVPESHNCIALSDALYSGKLMRELGLERRMPADSIVSLLRACANADGGFGWFAGMRSSAAVTALLLEREAAMGGDMLGNELCTAAVRFLDDVFFDAASRSGLGLRRYLRVRSLFPQVPFELPSGEAGRSFREEVRGYLIPRGDRGLRGDIARKVERAFTLKSLLSSEDGRRLATLWGIGSPRRMEKSMERERESLGQYASAHESGGMYFPAAALTWRPLLESNLRTHVMLCGLFEGEELADGIRLWMMLQKETQKWDDDPAFLEALSCVFRADRSLLDTKVLVLEASGELPFEQVKAASGGFSLKYSYTREGKELKDGDTLRLGDRVVGRYAVSSPDSRSFVRLSIPRPAAFRPVNQLSGRCCNPLHSPLRAYDTYRNVKACETEYWFEVFPEEGGAVQEEYFVVQEGRFVSPAPEIESLYSVHYRANAEKYTIFVNDERSSDL